MGTQYCSVIFYHNNKQKEEAEAAKDHVGKELKKTIVTQIVRFQKFYPAEGHHQ